MMLDKSITIHQDIKMKIRIAKIYIDGSYNPTTYVIGCAVVLFDGTSKRPYRIAFGKKLKSQINYGSSIAEMTAVKTAIKAAISQGFTHIRIYHDWNGQDFFSHTENIKIRHKACPNFIEYANYVDSAREKIKIRFIKVKAHSDNEYNRLVDKMARVQVMTCSVYE